MTVAEIYEYINSFSPFEIQEGWDNSGLIVGHPDRKVSKIVTSLDIDEEMIAEADEDTLFVIHHPLIFGKLEKLDFSSYPANIIEKVVLKRQAIIAAHTNFDQTHLNRYVFEKILGFKIFREKPFIYETEGSWKLEELKKKLKEKLGLDILKIVNPKEKINSIALTTGAGASLMDSVEADCFLTGDIKYHDAMKAESLGLMMIDIGHWESERFFAELMREELKNLPISVIISQSKNPFTI